MERKGRCLCGAVSYTAKGLGPELGVCHCGMCRRWSGGPLFATSTKDLVWEGEDTIATYQSSEWAERGFCSACGSALFYRVTAPGPYHGDTHLAFGTLDNQSGFDLVRELFIDRKPGAYALTGERQKLTEAEVFAMFGGEG